MKRQCTCLLFLLVSCGKNEATHSISPSPHTFPPVEVNVAEPLIKTVTEWDSYTGRIEAMESVEIRARVSGYLEQVYFKDGDTVKKGDVLFVIDPRPYQATLERIQAELEKAKTRLELAKNNLQRAELLWTSKAISEEDYDNRHETVREMEASVRSTEADKKSAHLNVEFTEIRAPITGRIENKRISAGSVVNADQTVLTTLISTDPVYVYVHANERAILKYRRAWSSQRHAITQGVHIPAELALLDEVGFLHRGYIDYIEPHLDANTGTLRVRGVFPNPDELLSPGLFATLRIPGGIPHEAVLIPERAVGTDQHQHFVWIAKGDSAIEYRSVTLGATFGQLREVTHGLQSNDLVVVEGIQKLRPGVKIHPTRQNIADMTPSL